MGNEGARSAGLPKAMVPIEDCVNGLVTAVSVFFSSYSVTLLTECKT